MVEKHFGLRRRPFRATPDADTYYPATTHERALARLAQGITNDEGLLLLTGSPGTGKTLLCHRLLEQLGPETISAFLTNSHIRDRTGLLQTILYDLSLLYEGRGEQELRLTLTDHLLQNFAAGRRTVLLVDEAQHLSPDLLEELRLLSNLEAQQGKAVQVVLAAQPEILDRLRLPELAAFQQRLVVRAGLEPLGVHEAADYLVHQLRAAGGRPERIISDEGLEILARGAQGVPRLLNQAALQALFLASTAGVSQVDAEAALEALAVLGLDEGGPLKETVDLGAGLATAKLSHSAQEEISGSDSQSEQTVPDTRPLTHPLNAHFAGEADEPQRLLTATRRPA